MKLKSEIINQLNDLMQPNGAICDFGQLESLLSSAIREAELRHPDKGICAVKQWSWWDYELDDIGRTMFSEANLTPSIIYANYIIWDKFDRWPKGYKVKTTPLIQFEDPCFFVTRNTVYILIGKGDRKTVDPMLAYNIRF